VLYFSVHAYQQSLQLLSCLVLFHNQLLHILVLLSILMNNLKLISVHILHRSQPCYGFNLLVVLSTFLTGAITNQFIDLIMVHYGSVFTTYLLVILLLHLFTPSLKISFSVIILIMYILCNQDMSRLHVLCLCFVGILVPNSLNLVSHWIQHTDTRMVQTWWPIQQCIILCGIWLHKSISIECVTHISIIWVIIFPDMLLRCLMLLSL